MKTLGFAFPLAHHYCRFNNVLRSRVSQNGIQFIAISLKFSYIVIKTLKEVNELKEFDPENPVNKRSLFMKKHEKV